MQSINLPRFLNDFTQDPDGVIVGHVFKVNIIDLQYHVARFDSAV